MNWEAITALATAFTGVVILVTVLVGVRQLRQLQRATQLEGMMKLLEDLERPHILQAIEFVRHELPKQLEDESYRRSLEQARVQQHDHPVFIVLRWLEKIGTLAKYGLIDPEPLYALNSPDYQHLWTVLRKVVQMHRTGALPAFDNAEYLCTNAWRWLRAAHGREAYEYLAARYGWEEPTPAG